MPGGDDAAAPEGAAGADGAEATFRQQYLFAFAPQAELVQHVRTQAAPAEVARLPELLEAWNAAQSRLQSLLRREAGQVGGGPAVPIPAEIEEQVAGYAADPMFQRTIWKLPVRFGMVEIDRLVAAQRHVHLDYADALAAAYPAKPTLADLAAICLSPDRSAQPVQHLEIAPNAHIFSSPNPDLRFLGSYVRPLEPGDLEHAHGGGVPAAVLISFVGFSWSAVSVFEAGGRLVLANGFHRLFALRRLGVRQVPAVIQIARNPALEFPPSVAQLPREYLLGAPRPALMRDFAEPAYSVELRIRRRLKMVLVNMSLGQHEVPY